MALLDKVSGDLNIYIGGFVSRNFTPDNATWYTDSDMLFTLRRKEALRESGITHVLSVLKLPLDENLFKGFTHKVVEVDDVDDENLLEHFPSCNSFIQDGLDSGGGVLVHCAMGKSRSATVVCAYLMNHFGIDAEQALAHIRETRPFCDPNDGFMKQLDLYRRMATTDNIEESPIYQRWLYQREVELSRACGQAPEADKIRFEDEHAQEASKGQADFELKCKKCRRPLATSQYLTSHQPRQNTTSQSSSTSSPACAHYFLEPLSWMRPELEQGKLDGRLECPKCHTNVGKYAWQGMQCSCGDWVLPAISIAKGRVDEGKVRAPGGATAASMGIRMPPGAGVPPSNGTGAAPRTGGQHNL